VVPEDQVRAALDRILATADFQGAERLSRFLRLVVEKALAGKGGELKEYLIGVEAYDRGTDFDPRLDPIVRVEARRLRAKLQEYYEGPGRLDPVRIEFRKGSYAPSFEPRSESPVDEPVAPVSRSRSRVWAAALGVVALLAAGALLSRPGSPTAKTYSIAVIPAIEGGEFGDALAESVSVELARNPSLKVLAWPVFKDYRDHDPDRAQTKLGKVANDLHVEVVLWVSVRDAGSRRNIAAHLMRPEQGWKQWAGEFERSTTDPFAVQREVARAIADEVRAVVDRGDLK
jgi:TolB-like protein